MGVILFILSNVLGCILVPLGVIYGLFKAFYQHHFSIGVAGANLKLVGLAKALDKYGNVVCAELFNDAFITRAAPVKFGDIQQTISMVIGYNLQAGTLTRAGRALNAVLDFFDPDHSLKAINQQ